MSGHTPDLSELAHELHATQHRLEQIFLASPLAMIEADQRGVITRWSPAAARIFGWSAEEAVGKNAIALVGLGLDLSGITNLATLQSGIAFALSRR